MSVVLREKGKPAVLAKVESTAGPDGRPQQVRLPYRPTQVGQFEYVVEVEPQEGELQTENNRRRAHRPGPQGEDPRPAGPGLSELRVPLSAQHAPARRNDRACTPSCKTPTWNTPSRTPRRCGPFRSRRDELFAYDVVILGDANPALLERGGAAKPGRFRRPAGQGRRAGADRRAVVHAGGLPRHAAGPAVAVLGRWRPTTRIRPTRSPKASSCSRPISDWPIPAMQLGDTPEETAAIWRNWPPLGLAAGIARAQAGRARAGRASHARRPRRPPPAGVLLPVRGGGQGAVPRHRRDLALALSRGRRVFRPLLDANDPLSLPLEAGRRRPRGHAR